MENKVKGERGLQKHRSLKKGQDECAEVVSAIASACLA
jgi:hypothetical protein